MESNQVLVNIGFRLLSVDNSPENIQRLKKAANSLSNKKFNDVLVRNIKMSNGNEDVITAMIEQYITKINHESLKNDNLSVFFFLDEYCVLEYDEFNCGFYFPNQYKYGEDLPVDIEHSISSACNIVESYNLHNPKLHIIVLCAIDKLNPITIFENIQ